MDLDNPGLFRNARHHLAPFTGLDSWIDPAHLALVRNDGSVNEKPLETMVEIPVIHHVLVIPDDLAGIGIQCQVELWYRYFLSVPASMNLGAGEVTDVPI